MAWEEVNTLGGEKRTQMTFVNKKFMGTNRGNMSIPRQYIHIYLTCALCGVTLRRYLHDNRQLKKIQTKSVNYKRLTPLNFKLILHVFVFVVAFTSDHSATKTWVAGRIKVATIYITHTHTSTQAFMYANGLTDGQTDSL